MEKVILVDEHDNAVGTMEKMEAHRKGVLHRAFSVVLFNSKGEILLQKRALSKYHSGGLWTNTCCSHPLPGESLESATQRKLMHEMGIDLKTDYSFKFLYRSELDQGLTEHELDHVFTGVFDGRPSINTDEVEAWRYTDLDSLKDDIRENPHHYTSWFKLIVDHPSFNVTMKSEPVK